MGLDLGGDGPEAIALAVIAEAQACCQGKLGASRRLSAEDVAEQIARGWGCAVSAGAVCALSCAGVVLAAGGSRRLGRAEADGWVGWGDAAGAGGSGGR